MRAPPVIFDQKFDSRDKGALMELSFRIG